jgi:hypothetical protein
MPTDDLFERWKQQRRQPRAPAGFADRVMAAVPDADLLKARRRALQAYLAALLSTKIGRLGVCSLAFLIGLFRLFQVVGIFLPLSYGQ